MTDINQAGLEAAQLAIAKCTAVGRTTLEDHAYEAVTAYLEATEGGGDAPQATDDDLVERLEFVRELLASLAYLSYADDVKAAAARIEQLEANRAQGEAICSEIMPVWVCADSMTIDGLDAAADMVFTCPPYADLEVYSDDPKDISTMPYDRFIEAYSAIIEKTCGKLKADRFAVVVVGEVRNKKGGYYNFVGDTIQAFKNAGMTYYNEMILITAAGSLPIRVGGQFNASRKIGKTHQNVLVFVKGDGKKATKACGHVDIKTELPEDSGEAFSPNMRNGA